MRAIAVFLLLSAGLHSQTDSTFEVASIKPAAHPKPDGGISDLPGGGIRVESMTMKALVAFAWSLQPFQVYSGPRWIDSEYYDILAKSADDPAAKNPGRVDMLRSLLLSRFALSHHYESRESSYYELVLGATRNAPGLVAASDGSCANDGEENRRNSLHFASGEIYATAISVQALAETISRLEGRVVVDRTGLSGRYNVKLEWASDEKPDIAGPSIFTAIQRSRPQAAIRPRPAF
jgi:uncharacterized protein (TIGR03435 family)